MAFPEIKKNYFNDTEVMGIRKTYRVSCSYLKKLTNDVRVCIQHYYYRLTSKYTKDNYKSIPIIINNFNRLAYLRRMIASLQNRGYTNLIILDNASTYPPLLEWYENECKAKVIKLGANFGHTALWASGMIERFNNDYFVYTDPDLELLDECPDDFLWRMLQNLKARVKGQKVALSLKIDDIPDDYPYKEDVLRQEIPFYSTMEYGMYVADVDTTFALHEPYAEGGYVDGMATYRMPYPIQCRHLPWYEVSEKRLEEDAYYIAHKRSDLSWWMK